MQAIRRLLPYVILVSLAWSCGDDPEPVDCNVSGPIMSLGAVTSATSCSVADGSISVSATGGKEPYQFVLNGGAIQESGTFSGLRAGYYTVAVTDANGCSKSVDNVSVKAADFDVNAVIETDQLCVGGNGRVTINVQPVNPPYQFKLGTGTFSESNVFSDLNVGTYGITVQDNIGCSLFLSVTVPRGQTGTSWEKDILPIIKASCATSGCHDGSARVDLRIFENAKQHAGSIRSKTQDRSMPRDGTISQQQIDIIACWVDDGALKN